MYNEIIISSGGIKGIALIGAIYYFSLIYSLDNIQYFTGCSIGSFICTLLVIGYTPLEVRDILINTSFFECHSLSLSNLLNNYGLDNSVGLYLLISDLFTKKNININITFVQLFNLTNKTLTFSISNISTCNIEYHNYINTPNNKIINSLLGSATIPLLHMPQYINNNLYVDGGIYDMFPFNVFSHTKKIGFLVMTEEQYNIVYDINNISYYNIFDYLKNITYNIITYNFKKIFKDIKYNKNIIHIIQNDDIQHYINIQSYYKKIFFNGIYSFYIWRLMRLKSNII